MPIMLSFYLSALETDAEKQRFIQIYNQCHDHMERTAFRILNDQHDAEDAVQNAFMQIIRHFGKTSEIPSKELPFWCISIVKNEARMILRKKRRFVHLEDWDAVAADTGTVSDYDGLVQLFSTLPETYRAALEMKYLAGLSGKEIAAHLGISESAVNTRISRARALLREIVEKEGFRL